MRNRIVLTPAAERQRDEDSHAFTSGISELLATRPVRVPRDIAAKLVTQYYFTVSSRTMERWPVSWRSLNGKAHVETPELFEAAQQMLDRSPLIRGGRTRASEQRTRAA